MVKAWRGSCRVTDPVVVTRYKRTVSAVNQVSLGTGGEQTPTLLTSMT